MINYDYDPHFHKKPLNDFDIMKDSCELTSSCKVSCKKNKGGYYRRNKKRLKRLLPYLPQCMKEDLLKCQLFILCWILSLLD